jgi:hypothetical protein
MASEAAAAAQQAERALAAGRPGDVAGALDAVELQVRGVQSACGGEREKKETRRAFASVIKKK